MKDVVIIPTYNERENIGNLVRAVFSFYPDVHILVVDDNSPDGTALEVEAAKKEIANLELFLRTKKEGLGKAYIASFKKVLADPSVRSICTMDADFSHSIRYLATMFSEIGKYDAVVGSRYVPGGGVEGYKPLRMAISKAAALYCRMMFSLPIKDYTSGFICVRADFLRKINFEKISASGFAFLIELKYLLWKKGAKFKEFPILLKNRREGKSKIGKKIMLEGLFLPWKLFFRNYKNKARNVYRVIKDVIQKRGLFFVLYYGPKVIVRTYLKKNKKSFIFQSKEYNYFYHLYNCSCLNERAVEVPIIWQQVQNYQGKRILELGNVLSHYYNFPHDIVDKYEKFDGVINQDIVDFRSEKKYDLIVSISTLEHVAEFSSAIENLKNHLNAGGKIIATLCLGYSPQVDKLLEEGNLGFKKQYFMKRVSGGNDWQEANYDEVRGIKYDYAGWTARGIVIGVIEN